MGKLERKNIEDVLALAPLQEGILFHYLRNPGNNFYFEQLSLTMSGIIDTAIFEKAWNFVIRSNEMLRVVFWWENVENPIQVILKNHYLSCEYYDLSGENEAKVKKRLDEIKSKDIENQFDLREVPFRIILCKMGENKYEMIISNHHILYDGWSNGVLLKEFISTYYDLSRGKELIKPDKLKFKDFIKWIQNQDKNEQEKFWRDYLKGFTTQTGLPLKRKKEKEVLAARVGNLHMRLEGNIKNKIERLVKEQGITLASFLFSAWGLLLQKYNNCRDVIFGTTVSGRSARLKGIEEVVGLFVNTLPLRVWTASQEKIRDLLHRINKVLLMREPYESTSLADIKQYSEIDNQEELFDSVFVLENYPLKSRLPQENHRFSLSIDSYAAVENSHYDLTAAVELFSGIEVNFYYNKQIFAEESAARIIRHFHCLLLEMVRDPGENVSEIEIISREERKQLLREFNDTGADFPKDKTIVQLFMEQVRRRPHQLALVGKDDGWKSEKVEGEGKSKAESYAWGHLTYEKLNRLSNQLADLLREKGVEPDTIVALLVNRSPWIIVSIMAVLKAGGAYLPIDPDYPQERIDYMLKDSGAKILLTGQEIAGLYSPQALLNLSEEYNFTNDQYPMTNEHLAYIIYTSGSTGKPKGVLIEHRSVVRLLFNDKFAFDFTNRDVWTMFHSYSFDFSVWEMYGALLYGGKLVVIPPMTARDTRRFLEVLRTQNVTVLNQTPAAFYNLVEMELPETNKELTLKYIIFGGEALNPIKLKEWKEKYPGVKLINMYGITEITVHATYKEITTHDIRLAVSNIGKPIPTTVIYVLDRNKKLVPVGLSGELHVGGEGVARGYLNNPGLTAEKFDHDLWDLQDDQDEYHRSYRSYMTYISKRIYKTGDQGRWLADGELEYLGRIDHQVKIRGYRIEIGEIQHQLLQHDKINKALVVAKEENNSKYLCAYLVSQEKINIAEIRDFLLRKLPVYMVPAYFMQLDELPLTPNGKIDKRALPDPIPGQVTQYAAPRSKIEEILLETWQHVLERNNIGINDNFFFIGGDSIKTIQIAARMSKAGYSIDIKDIFQQPSIAELAPLVVKSTKIADRAAVTETACSRLREGELIPADLTYKKLSPDEVEGLQRRYPLEDIYPLSPMQEGMYFHYLYDGTEAYFEQVSFRMRGDWDMACAETGLNELIKRHDILRTVFIREGENLLQVVLKQRKIDFLYEDISTRDDKYDYISRFKEKDKKRSFDLSKDVLVRAAIFKLEDRVYEFIWTYHHIVIDGWSMGRLAAEFFEIYNSLKAGRLVQLPQVRPYRTYIRWLAGQDRETPEEYWKKYLEKYTKPVGLTGMNPARVIPGGNRIERFFFQVETKKKRLLQELCARNRVTLNTAVNAVWGIILAKYNNKNDVVFGTVVSGRPPGIRDVETMIGLFINTVPVRIQFTGDNSFKDLISRVQREAIAGQPYHHYPLADIQSQSQVKQQLFDNFITFNQTIFCEPQIMKNEENRENLSLKILNQESFGHSNYDFNLIVNVHEQLDMEIKYNTGTIAADIVKKMASYIEEVIDIIIADDTVKIEDIKLSHRLSMAAGNVLHGDHGDFRL